MKKLIIILFFIPWALAGQMEIDTTYKVIYQGKTFYVPYETAIAIRGLARDSVRIGDILIYGDGDTLKLNGNLMIAQDLEVTGNMYQVQPHLKRLYYDSSYVVASFPATAQIITNDNDSLYSVIDQDDISVSGDTTITDIKGSMKFTFKCNFTADAAGTFVVYIVQNADTLYCEEYITTVSVTRVSISLPSFYIECLPGDRIFYQLAQTSGTADLTFTSGYLTVTTEYLER